MRNSKNILTVDNADRLFRYFRRHKVFICNSSPSRWGSRRKETDMMEDAHKFQGGESHVSGLDSDINISQFHAICRLQK